MVGVVAGAGSALIALNEFRRIGPAIAGDANFGWPLLWTAVFGAASVWAFRLVIIVPPNEARVMLRFGKYVGTIRDDGWYTLIPFTQVAGASLRVAVLETENITVNDADGNPVEVAAMISWRVHDAAKSVLDIEDTDALVAAQAEASLRALVSQHSYDSEGDGTDLRSGHEDLADELQRSLMRRLRNAGVEVVDARISHIAYAPEIASAMLQKQQAQAVLAARKLLVEGAVNIAEEALQRIAKNPDVPMDDATKARLVSDLLVVLASDRGAQPVVTTGGARA